MKTPRNLIQGLSGGILGGALTGLAEASYLIATAGASDYLSPFYATALYGLIGAPLGLGAGLALSGVEKARGEVSDGFAWAWGFCGGMAPQAAFVLLYIVRKVVYLEQGMPPQGLAGVVGAVGVLSLVSLVLASRLVSGPLKAMLNAKGLAGGWGGLLVLTGAVALAPLTDDPRAGFASGKSVPEGMADRPDVLVIMVDTLRADYLGAYGKEGNPTPALDALAADAVLFESAFAQASWTRSSGATLFTSRIPSSHNAGTKAARLSGEAVTFAEPLQAAGVTTGALINNINMTGTFGFNQGFDSFLYESPDYHYFATESVFGLTMYKVVHKLSERLPLPKVVESFYQPAEVVLEDTKAFFEANDDGRIALFTHLMEPHDPYFEHPSLNSDGPDFNGIGYARAEHEHPDMADAEYLREVYLDEIKWMDAELARFFGWLRETGRYDDLMIVITADHGEEFGEHGGFWHGTTLYDEQLHIPLIIKLPGNAHAGTRVPWQVRSLDVAPTIAAAMGVSADDSWQGTDLFADVEGWLAERARAEAEAAELAALEAEGDTPPAPVEVEEETADDVAEEEAVEPRNWERLVLAEEDFEGNVIAAIRSEGLKYIRAQEGGPRGLVPQELFDIQVDSLETKNLLESGSPVEGVYPEDHAKRLDSLLNESVLEAAAGGLSGGSATTSAAECERLKALGYLAADEDCSKQP
ncbi:MAG: sulfatase-like hydrolase/transferase [Proteobacteria bacterium]|nr:sulfatase-like hydrolase/transferase [Pseudomonadota bacterium]